MALKKNEIEFAYRCLKKGFSTVSIASVLTICRLAKIEPRRFEKTHDVLTADIKTLSHQLAQP